MKLKKFGKALLTGVLSVGVVFGVSSCVQSYTVGFLYVTGTVTADPTGNGIISGYKIDHNTGELYPINTLPVSSGGANPVRAVLVDGSRFLYVLNRGMNQYGTGDCYGTGAYECLNPSITQFAVGGSGSLTFQETFYTQGLNPFRLIADSTGSYLMVLDHDAPSGAACQAALGTGITACADITVFQVNSTTGRLSLVQNAAVSAAGTPLNYFPVLANPVDFVMSGNYVFTLTSASPATAYPYTGGSIVFPYAYSANGGQLTISQTHLQTLSGVNQGTAIINADNYVWVLDNEAIMYTNNNGVQTQTNSQIVPYTVGPNGALDATTSGAVPGDPTVTYPIQLMVDTKDHYVFVANQGANIPGAEEESEVSGYTIYTSPSFQLQFTPGEPWGTGSGPQCIVEDPSNQFIYEANLYSSNVTGNVLDPNAGVLDQLRSPSNAYPLQGPATWCLVDGRTS